jgi:hypothetical protein
MERDSRGYYVAFVSFPKMFVVKADNIQQARNKALSYACADVVFDKPYAKEVKEDKEYSDSPEIINIDTMDEYAGDDAEKEIQKFFNKED